MSALVSEAANAIESGDREANILESARRLCRLTLRNQQPADAFSILLAALTELARDAEFRDDSSAGAATAEAARIFAEIHAEFIRDSARRPIH